MGKGAIIMGLIMLGIGAFIIISGTITLNSFFNGNLGIGFGIYYVGYFLTLIGAIILGAHFKGWLERTSGTRFR